jgi:hypothetical protein
MEIMESATPVRLPAGFWHDGMRHQEAGLRSLSGNDEAFLLEMGESLLPAQRTTALLARCLMYLGSLDRVTAETTASLTAGDREALILHLRRLTLGERLQCGLACPGSECGEKMDLDLRVSDLLLPPYPHAREWYETTIAENGTRYSVRFRLPTGAYQEEAATLALSDPQAAAYLLLRRCVERITTEDGQPVEDIPPVVIDRLPTLIDELDPQAELRLDLTCPSCGHAFTTLLDASIYFFQELADRIKHLYREVHLLAFYYHWSEAEIMGMTAGKRRRYLDLLTEALTEEGRL